MVPVVRFSDGEQLEAPRPVIDVSAITTIEAEAETAALAADAIVKKAGRGRKSGDEWLGRRQRKYAPKNGHG
jgi:hypothetical protein